MPKIKKKNVPKHYLIVDTNELFQEVKNEKISESFEKFWFAYGNKYSLQVLIPNVVLGELKYQHTQHAQKILSRIESQCKTLSTSTSKDYFVPASHKKVKSDVEAKISKWIKFIKAEVVETPINSINWNGLIDNAIWRLPPFDSDPSKEKGFRDALIYETTVQLVKENPHNTYAFVSNDRLLSDTTEKALKKNDNCSVFETLEDFSSYLKLLDEKLSSDFVKSIQRRAKEKFHSRTGSNDLITKEGIVKFITDEFSDAFKINENYGFGVGLMGLQSLANQGQKGSWSQINKEGIWIQSPEFNKKEGDRTYWWQSTIKFVQLFKYSSGSGDTILGSYLDGEVRVRIFPFTVIWKSDVKTDGRFFNIEFVEVTQEEKIFEKPTDEQVDRYNLEQQLQD
jgi:hypothetical protein